METIAFIGLALFIFLMITGLIEDVVFLPWIIADKISDYRYKKQQENK
jgi:hypothetical protein